jgi:hypothetical protein
MARCIERHTLATQLLQRAADLPETSQLVSRPLISPNADWQRFAAAQRYGVSLTSGGRHRGSTTDALRLGRPANRGVGYAAPPVKRYQLAIRNARPSCR